MTIYHLINNEDYPDVCFSSTDKGLLEEIMCDYFMTDVMYEFNAQVYGQYSNNDDITVIAKRAWDWTIDYYNDYIDIVSSELIGDVG